jgi:hypothetical protein
VTVKREILSLAVAWILLTATALCPPPAAYAANTQEDWRVEFDDLCSKTDVVAALKQPELKGLIERCDRLKPRIEKLDESAAKVYLKRLQMCRNLFVFMLESSSP